MHVRPPCVSFSILCLSTLHSRQFVPSLTFRLLILSSVVSNKVLKIYVLNMCFLFWKLALVLFFKSPMAFLIVSNFLWKISKSTHLEHGKQLLRSSARQFQYLLFLWLLMYACLSFTEYWGLHLQGYLYKEAGSCDDAVFVQRAHKALAFWTTCFQFQD